MPVQSIELDPTPLFIDKYAEDLPDEVPNEVPNLSYSPVIGSSIAVNNAGMGSDGLLCLKVLTLITFTSGLLSTMPLKPWEER